MKHKSIILYLLLSLVFIQFSCEPQTDDIPSIGELPSAEISVQAVDANNYIFSVSNLQNGFLYNWDLGNGTLSNLMTVEGYFGFPGEYPVQLIVSGKGGSTTITHNLNITTGDPAIFQNEDFLLLTGYNLETNQSTRVWVWDQEAGASAVGPPVWGESNYNDPIDVSWWASDAGGFATMGCYNDEYSFKLNKQMEYINNCNGDFLFNWAWANELLGANQGEYEDAAFPYEPATSSWSLTYDEFGNKILSLSNDGFLGMAAGQHVYQILELTENVLWIRYESGAPGAPSGIDKGEWAYLRFVAQ